MAFYELTFITRPDMNRPDVEKLMEHFVGIAKEQQGKLVKQEYWGLRPLAYKINKNSRGHYAMLCLEAPGTAVAELTRTLGLHEDIVRHMIVKVDAISDKPSPMMRHTGEDERPRRVA